MRRALGSLKPIDGARKLVELLEEYPTNAEMLTNRFADVAKKLNDR